MIYLYVAQIYRHMEKTFDLIAVTENTYSPVNDGNALLFLACVLLYILYYVVSWKREYRRMLYRRQVDRMREKYK